MFPQRLLHQLFPLFLKSSIILSLHWLLLPPATNILRYPSSSEKKYPTKASVSPSTIILFRLLLKGTLLVLDLHLPHQHNLILLPAPPPTAPHSMETALGKVNSDQLLVVKSSHVLWSSFYLASQWPDISIYFSSLELFSSDVPPTMDTHSYNPHWCCECACVCVCVCVCMCVCAHACMRSVVSYSL